eukprot:COSAG06_NODE_1365_length_9687_cov_14.601064_10_plen_61_part_00
MWHSVAVVYRQTVVERRNGAKRREDTTPSDSSCGSGVGQVSVAFFLVSLCEVPAGRARVM